VLDAPRLRFSLIWSQREFNDSGYKALATLAEHRLPLTGLAENFSPMLRMAPPPFAREIDGKEGPFCAATSLPPGFSARSLDHLSRSFLAFIFEFSGSLVAKLQEPRTTCAVRCGADACYNLHSSDPEPSDAYRITASGERGNRTNNVRGFRTLRTDSTFVYTHSYVSNRSNKVHAIVLFGTSGAAV
jgi:hypothetical protein